MAGPKFKKIIAQVNKKKAKGGSTASTYDHVSGLLGQLGRSGSFDYNPDTPTSLQPAPAPGPSTALLALLAEAQGDGSDGFQLLPAPNHDSYLQPYTAAEAAANKSYGEAVPALHQLYSQLQSNLASTNKDFTGAVQGLRDERSGQMQQRLAEVSAPQAQQAALVDGGEVASHASDAQAQSIDRLKATFDAERSRDNRLAQVDAQAATSRQQDAQTAEQSSVGTARNNLDSVLQQIGLGKAQAERQYQSDSAQVTGQNNQIRSAQAQQKQQAAQTKLKSFLEMNQSIAKQATVTGKQKFEGYIGQAAASYPRAFAVFQDIVGAAGKGATGKANALRILDSGDAQAGKYELKDGTVIASRLGDKTLRKWISDYYDETPSIDQATFEALGGDPSALNYLDSSTDPKLAASMIALGL